KRWMQENDALKSGHESMKAIILSHPVISEFLETQRETDEKEVDKRLNRLNEYLTQSIRCSDCKNDHACNNMLKGYSPILQVVQGEIHLAYEKCPNHLRSEEHTSELQSRLDLVCRLLLVK